MLAMKWCQCGFAAPCQPQCNKFRSSWKRAWLCCTHSEKRRVCGHSLPCVGDGCCSVQKKKGNENTRLLCLVLSTNIVKVKSDISLSWVSGCYLTILEVHCHVMGVNDPDLNVSNLVFVSEWSRVSLSTEKLEESFLFERLLKASLGRRVLLAEEFISWFPLSCMCKHVLGFSPMGKCVDVD